MQNGELNPCCKREKLKEVLLGHQPYRMAKALWDHSMVEKHETGEHARLVVVQDPRDTVKAGLPESQSPGMERNVSMIMRQALVQFKLGSSGSL